MYTPDTYTCESVTNGHPDKICDQISDAILDACLEQDPASRVAVETFGGHGLIVIGGEVTTRAEVDYAAIALGVYRDIGYMDTPDIITRVMRQSPDIAQGVDTGGAGDQEMMYGYATDETAEFLPRGYVLATRLARELERLRTSGELPWLRPDGKTQVTMKDGRIAQVLVSAQHSADVSQNDVFQNLIHKLTIPVVRDVAREWGEPADYPVPMLIYPTGNFVRGGFDADTGLTGRKIMVDTYGGLAPHGGGAFSGKDPSKVDRSAAYMCRFVARQLVARGLGHRVLVSVAYAIGVAEPLMVTAVNESGEDLSVWLREFDFRPLAIIERLGLRAPIYRAAASGGHFGRKGFAWEE
jgi:S-adenosylmethionine synthetase